MRNEYAEYQAWKNVFECTGIFTWANTVYSVLQSSCLISRLFALSCLEGQFSADNDGEAGCRAARRQAGN